MPIVPTTGAPPHAHTASAPIIALMREPLGAGDRVLVLLPWETPGSVGDLLAQGISRFGAVQVLASAGGKSILTNQP